jgi:RNA polymerase sigma factor (sigma-70 family)
VTLIGSHFRRMVQVARLTARTPVEKLFADNLPLVSYVAYKYRKRQGRIATDDDLTTGMLALHRAAELFNPSLGFKFSTYAHTSIWRHFQRVDKEKRKHLTLPLDAARYVAEPPPDSEAAKAKDILPLVRKAFSAMREDDADLVRMHFLDGMTLQEIGDVIGVSRARIGQRIDRALEAARRSKGAR